MLCSLNAYSRVKVLLVVFVIEIPLIDDVISAPELPRLEAQPEAKK